MTAATGLSRVASPRECDIRQLSENRHLHATTSATPDATTSLKPASLRDLARDTLMRHRRDKAVAPNELHDAIRACCVARCDSDENCAALIAESAALTPAQRADMLEHFTEQAAIWATATKAIP